MTSEEPADNACYFAAEGKLIKIARTIAIEGEDMGDHQELKLNTALPVRLWGVDSYSRPFMQIASVRVLGNMGIVLCNVRAKVRPGEILDLQNDGLKAQFRVVWAGQPGTMEAGEVGLERLPDEPHIWDVDSARCGPMVGSG